MLAHDVVAAYSNILIRNLLIDNARTSKKNYLFDTNIRNNPSKISLRSARCTVNTVHITSESGGADTRHIDIGASLILFAWHIAEKDTVNLELS